MYFAWCFSEIVHDTHKRHRPTTHTQMHMHSVQYHRMTDVVFNTCEDFVGVFTIKENWLNIFFSYRYYNIILYVTIKDVKRECLQCWVYTLDIIYIETRIRIEWNGHARIVRPDDDDDDDVVLLFIIYYYREVSRRWKWVSW